MPTFAFNGQWTGNKGWLNQGTSQVNALADFLLGTANTAGTGLPGIDHVAYARDWEFYGQDTWQATSHLTLYYGLRFMYQQPWVVRDNLMTYLDLANNKLALPQNSATPTLPPYGANAALLAAYPFETTQSIGLPVRYNQAYGKNLGPRFGFAFRPFSNAATVIRGGYGIYYNFEPLLIGAYNEVNNPPWGGTAQTFSTQLTTGTAAGFQPDLTFSNPFPSNLVKSGVSANPTVYLIERNFKNAQAQEWNLSMEHQFGTNWVTRATYLGNKTDHIPWTGTDINVPVTQTPNTTTQNQRPWQPWGTIASYRSGAIQYYNSLQLEAIKRLSNGLSFQAEYEYTRSLDNVEFSGGMQNWHFPNADYGPTDDIRQHQLVFNYVWFLPVGRGQKLLSDMSKPLNAVLGGWEVSGITMYGTGIPFPVNFAVPSTKVGWWGGRADKVPGSAVYAKQSGHNIAGNGLPWFSTAAFAAPTAWTWGNSSRNSVFGPGMWNWDISALKNFNLPWSDKQRLQFRVDFIDAFNHFNLSNPNATIADTRDGGPAQPTAGNITSGAGNRVIDFALRYFF